jgi:hypothetical protein
LIGSPLTSKPVCHPQSYAKNRLACSGFPNSSHPHRHLSSFTSLLLVKVNLFVREGSIVVVPFGTLLSFSCRYRENQNQPPFVEPIPINRSKWPLQTRPLISNLIEIDKPSAKQHTIVTTISQCFPTPGRQLVSLPLSLSMPSTPLIPSPSWDPSSSTPMEHSISSRVCHPLSHPIASLWTVLTESGIAYQLTEADPLTNTAQCKLDAQLMQTLTANAIRVYHVNPAGDHDGCMTAFADAGIYLLVDLDTFNTAIDPVCPSLHSEESPRA